MPVTYNYSISRKEAQLHTSFPVKAATLPQQPSTWAIQVDSSYVKYLFPAAWIYYRGSDCENAPVQSSLQAAELHYAAGTVVMGYHALH